MLHSRCRLSGQRGTVDAGLCEVISVETGSGGASDDALPGGVVCVVLIGRLPGTLWVVLVVLKTQALLSGFQKVVELQMERI